MVDVLKKKKPGIFDCFFSNSEYIQNGIEFKKTRPYLFADKNSNDDNIIIEEDEKAKKKSLLKNSVKGK